MSSPAIRNLGPDDSGIMVQLACTIVSASGIGAPGTVRFCHNLDDPYALWMAALSSTGANMIGVLGFDLVNDAMSRPGILFGEGSVKTIMNPHALILEVSDSRKTATIAVIPAHLEPFVAAVRKRAAAALTAPEHDNLITRELDKILEGK
jgi:hypothetical protein